VKEQQKIIVLVPLVLLIWGYAIYALMGVSGGDKVSNNEIFAIEMPDDLSLSADSFELNLNYKDPFLKGIKYTPSKIPQVPVAQQKNIAKASKNTVPKKPWPRLIYKGTIKNKTTSTLIAILEINKVEALLKEGEEYQQIQVLDITSDSIYTAFGDEKKYILK
jgi:hypothetical protein